MFTDKARAKLPYPERIKHGETLSKSIYPEFLTPDGE